MLAAACGEPRLAADSPPIPTSGRAIGSRVDVFLRARDGAPGAVILEIEAAALVGPDGARLPLDLELATVSSAEATSGVRLAGGTAEPAAYDAVVLTLRGARLERDGVSRDLELIQPRGDADAPPPLPPAPDEQNVPIEYRIPTVIQVRTRDAVSIFLSWDVARSLEGAGFAPVWTADQETPRTLLGLLYVADGATGSVLALDRGTGAVTATGMSGAGPRALAASRDLRSLYVANQGDGSVTILDTRRNAPDAVLPIRLIAGTNDVVVAEDRRLLAAANRDINTVTFFDLRTLSRLEDVRVGRAPLRLAAAPGLRRVFVANSLSDSVSVIDIDSRAVIATLAVESAPVDVVLDRRERELYVAHRIGQNLLFVDAKTLAVVGNAFVGGDVTALLADRHRDRVYVARARPPELLIIERRVSAEIRRIPLSGIVEGLAQPLEGTLIYGAAPALGGVIAINVVHGREERVLRCGTSPTDVVVLD